MKVALCLLALAVLILVVGAIDYEAAAVSAAMLNE